MEQKKKVLRIRVEDTRDGKITEFETNCFMLVTSDREKEDEVSTNRTLGLAGASTNEVAALIMRSEEVTEELKDLFKGKGENS